jgi:hypothetical protein
MAEHVHVCELQARDLPASVAQQRDERVILRRPIFERRRQVAELAECGADRAQWQAPALDQVDPSRTVLEHRLGPCEQLLGALELGVGVGEHLLSRSVAAARGASGHGRRALLGGLRLAALHQHPFERLDRDSVDPAEPQKARDLTPLS